MTRVSRMGIRPVFRGGPRSAIQVAAAMVTALAIATIVVAVLENGLHVPYAAPVFLLAVLAIGVRDGAVAAVVTSIASFLLYDFFFIPPFLTFTVAEPSEWLNLLLFLAVSVVIGRLAALQAGQAREAAERAREAEALFGISRALATSGSVAQAAPLVLERIAASTAMDRAWLGRGPTPAEERIVADTGEGAPLPVPSLQVVLQRTADDAASRWVRTHAAATGMRRGREVVAVHRIRLEVSGEPLGSLWVLRSRELRDPDRAETRILSAAADQLGQAVRRDQLIAEATEAEVARRSEALKTALLDSVSHDLRTPLTSIRAAAGSLLDPQVTWSPEEVRESIRTIDAEAERMNRLVRNLLDLSRIEAGVLRPDLGPHDLDEVVDPVALRVGRSTGRRVSVDIPDEVPPVLVDDGYLDQVLTNLLENAARYGGGAIRVVARRMGGGDVEVAVEDDGPGVPPDVLPHLFEKFYRVPRTGEGSRHGMGVGLTVAQGLARALGGDIEAGPSELGGLAMRLRLRAAPLAPSDEALPAGAPA